MLLDQGFSTMTAWRRFFGLSLAISLIVAGCGPSKDNQQSSAPPVTAAKPLKKRVTEWDDYTGRFEAVESVEIRARVSGYLDSIKFTDGQTVKKDDLLFVIDQRPFQVALDQAEAQADSAAAAVDLATKSLARAAELRRSDNTPQSTYDERAASLRQAKASLTATQAQVNAAKLDLEFTEVRAPVAGRISSHYVSVGNLVTGGTTQGTLLTTIVSLDPIHFIFDGDEAAYIRYTRLSQSGVRQSSRDAPNPVRLALSDEADYPHEGHMDFVDNQIDRQTGTIRGRAIFANPVVNGQYLFTPGEFGRMRLLGRGDYEALLLPDSAIGIDQSHKIVMTVSKDGTVGAKSIVLGPLIDGLRVIREGLAADDVVIVNGLQRARPGQKVSPQMIDLSTAAGNAAQAAGAAP
jgi:RND family efflux transporter MFP subunit